MKKIFAHNFVFIHFHFLSLSLFSVRRFKPFQPIWMRSRKLQTLPPTQEVIYIIHKSVFFLLLARSFFSPNLWYGVLNRVTVTPLLCRRCVSFLAFSTFPPQFFHWFHVREFHFSRLQICVLDLALTLASALDHVLLWFWLAESNVISVPQHSRTECDTGNPLSLNENE